MSNLAPLSADANNYVCVQQDEIAEFLGRAFKHARPGEGVIAVRSFLNDGSDRQARGFDWVPLDDKAPARIADSARDAARRPAGPNGWTFAPPVCLFKIAVGEEEKRTAKEADIVFGGVISVDLDERPDASLAALVAVMGEPTIIVSSGGLWQGQERRHVYWRLRRPARDRIALGQLKAVRQYARALVGGDATGDPINHPMRWPGSVHTKAGPRATRITGGDADREVDLVEVGAALLDALHDAGIAIDGHIPDRPGRRNGFKTERAATLEQLLMIAADLPNKDLEWKIYRDRMMTWFDAAHGSSDGLEAAHIWAAKSSKYDPDEVDKSWSHISFYPADDLSIGSLIHLCREANPSFVLPRDRAFDTQIWFDAAPIAATEDMDERKGSVSITSWQSAAIKGENKKPAAVIANVVLAMTYDERINESFAFDEMAIRPVLLKALPGQSKLQRHRFVEDNDITRLQVYLQVEGLTRLGRDTAKQGILLRASERSFHPVRDYLNRISWDGIPRIEGWLSRYLGAEAKPYHNLIGAMFLISMVARVMKPGCQSDHMLVLEGDQGEQKSTACAVLAGEWFSDAMPDIRDKDASIHLAGKWLIEVSEMSATSKADHAALKAFISRPSERYRPPFGTFEVEQPRQVSFIGTTNSKAYLRDETGGRRFWPVQIGKIDIPALRRDRDQLFAEALAQYRDGKPWWPDKSFERAFVKPEQEARFEVDAWEESISDWLAERTEPFRVVDVARGPLRIMTDRIGTSDQRRITAALERLGYCRLPKDRIGNVRWAAKDPT